jgi:formylglycine-generating enzyme required for sulfatase activity
MRIPILWLAAALPNLVAGLPARAVEIEWVVVGDPGNPPDDAITAPRLCFEAVSGFGSVTQEYRIGRTEVTRSQYTAFLNAVATEADPNGLYDIQMTDGGAGISRTSNPPYVYVVAAGSEDLPVGAIDYYDTLRFANWLHNGQPSGPQSDATTEDGAYALHGSNPLPVTREPGALFFLPSEDEWYKAAYWDADLGEYRLFPTDSDDPPTLGPPSDAPNSANYGDCQTGVGCNPAQAVGDVTDVGAYTASGSPHGTFDQGGNLWEWSEDLFEPEPNADLDLSCPFWHAVTRGGAWNRGQNDLRSVVRTPTALDVCCSTGFRVAATPVPEAPFTLGAFTSLASLRLLRRVGAGRSGAARRPSTPGSPTA